MLKSKLSNAPVAVQQSLHLDAQHEPGRAAPEHAPAYAEGDRLAGHDVIPSAARNHGARDDDADERLHDDGGAGGFEGDEMKDAFTALELCAGGGGQALGLEMAGFAHTALVEIDAQACQTLKHNRPSWRVMQRDLREISGKEFRRVDLVAGGVPCPPFSIAGKQLGKKDERDLFPEALRLVEEIQPRAVMLENVRGLSTEKFAAYRTHIVERLDEMGYRCFWQLLNSSDYGVPQLRPRFVLVALKRRLAGAFKWPEPRPSTLTVGNVLGDLMASRGWAGAKEWVKKANDIAPTIVGGSKKHGGPDLGPTRARRQWLGLGVDGLGIANEIPGADYPREKLPRLTVQMVARLQGFPDEWEFVGGKTAAYRQVGNAFPPPVAAAVATAIHAALKSDRPAVSRAKATRQLGLGDLRHVG